uniref:Uncharacterized protein n=1 Tax=Oryza rufipogon TaxID=4529 RepID=A0A0E0MWH3_ORYRU
MADEDVPFEVALAAGDLRLVLVNGEDRDYLREEQRSSAIGIPCEKVRESGFLKDNFSQRWGSGLDSIRS